MSESRGKTKAILLNLLRMSDFDVKISTRLHQKFTELLLVFPKQSYSSYVCSRVVLSAFRSLSSMMLDNKAVYHFTYVVNI